jgi:hypothetical protein
MFPLYLEECPMVGDFIFVCDPEDSDKEEWFTDLYALCEDMLPKPKTVGYQFKVIDRTMMRIELESWWLIHLIYVPGIHDNTNNH